MKEKELLREVHALLLKEKKKMMVSSLQVSSAEFSYLSFRQFKPALSLNRWIKQVIFLFDWVLKNILLHSLTLALLLLPSKQNSALGSLFFSFFKEEKTCCVFLPLLESIIGIHKMCILAVVQITFTKWNSVMCGCFTV